MLKITLSLIAGLSLALGVVLLCGWLFNDFDGKVIAGWWGCLLYTYLTERSRATKKEVSNG